MFKTVIKEQLVVPAHIDYVADLREFVTKIGRKHGFSRNTINAFKLSIDEAATNIIKHAYRDSDGSITIRGIIKRNSLTFVLIDQGKYFDPRRVKDPDLKRYVKIGKKGGLGIFIMRRLLDSIDYRKTEEGNELRLTKNKEISFRHRLQVPSLSLSLKARYWGITCAIITAVVLIGYMVLYFRREGQIMDTVLSRAEPIAVSLNTSISSNISGNSIDFNEEIDAGVTIESVTSKYVDFVLDAFFTDLSGTVRATSENSPLYYTDFAYPDNYRSISETIKLYLNSSNIQVIDLNYPVYSNDTNEHIGYTHVWIKKDYADKIITHRRIEDLKLAALAALLGCAGTFILIYIVLNPFRKLTQWVRTLGHEEVEDEMDIDTSTEVGEIAQAFSEITTKLRQSQKNLAEQERLQKEMQVAQEIQRTLLPTDFPVVEGFGISSFYEAAKEVGGDYFDFVEVDRDTLGLAVADVSGKGVPGSLVMTMIRTALRTEARGLHSASEVLCRVNDFVMNDMKKGMFVTLFYVILDSKRRKINYSSAGHNPMILYRGATKKTYYLNPRGFPLGIALPEKDLFRTSIEADTIKLAPDDVLILYTDGITEAMNPKREMFGDERFLQTIRQYSHLSVEAFVEKVKDELHSFTEGNIQNDDITLVAIKEQMSAEQIELDRAKDVYRAIEQGTSIREACKNFGISTYAFNKYKPVFEKEGVETVAVEENIAAVEAKHLSIEEKTKIYDIIRQHPEYGAKRIVEELDTARYEYEHLSESIVYEELVRSRLNTRQLREAYVARRGTRRKMKPPGTPFLTLDGRVIIEKHEPHEPIVFHGERKKEKEPVEEEQVLEDAVVEKDENQLEEAEDAALLAEEVTEEAVKEEDVDDAERIAAEAGVPAEELLESSPEDSYFEEMLEELEIDGDSEESVVEEELQPIAEEESEAEEIEDADEVAEEEEKGIQLEKLLDEPLENLLQKKDQKKAKEPKQTQKKKSKEVEQPADETPGEKEEKIEAEENELVSEDAVDWLSFVDQDDEGVSEEIEEPESIDTSQDKAEEVSDEFDFALSELDFVEEWAGSDAEDKEESILDEFEERENNFSKKDDLESEEFLDESFDDELTYEDDEFWKGQDRESEVSDDLDLPEIEEEHDNMSFSELIDSMVVDSPQKSNGNGADSTVNYEEPSVTDEDKGAKKRRKKKSSKATAEEPEKEILRDKVLLKGLRYYKSQNYDEAIREFRKVVKSFSDFKEAHILLGNAYFKNKMFLEAVQEYSKVKEIDPNDTDAYENMGIIYANRGEFGKAIEEWENILTINPKRKDIEKNIERAQKILGR